MNIDLNEVIKKLQSKKKNVEGRSTREIMTELGKSDRVTHEFLRAAIDAGLCELAGYKSAPSIHGRNHNVPLYRFISASETKKKKAAKKERS